MHNYRNPSAFLFGLVGVRSLLLAFFAYRKGLYEFYVEAISAY